MANPGLGINSYMQLVKEASYGAGGTCVAKFELVKEDIKPERSKILDPSLYNGYSQRGIYPGGIVYKGTVTVRLNYDGLGELLRAVLPTYSRTQVETTAYDFLFKEGASTNSYGLEFIKGSIPSGKCFAVTGAKFTGLTIRGAAGNDSMLQADLDIVAKDMTSNASPTGTLSFAAVYPVLGSQAITVDDGVVSDGTARIKTFEVSLTRPHTEDRAYIGSSTIDEPLQNGMIDVSWKFTQEFNSITAYDAVRSGTSTCSPKLIFQHTATIGASSKREFEFRSGTALAADWGTPVDGPGVLNTSLTMDAAYDSGDASALVVRFRSTDAALSA